MLLVTSFSVCNTFITFISFNILRTIQYILIKFYIPIDIEEVHFGIEYGPILFVFNRVMVLD